MVKDKEDIIEELEELEEEEVIDLDTDLMKKFSERFQEVISKTLDENTVNDGRHELLTTLLFFSAHVASELDLTEDSLLEVLSKLFNSADITGDEDEDEYIPNIVETKNEKFKLN